MLKWAVNSHPEKLRQTLSCRVYNNFRLWLSVHGACDQHSLKQRANIIEVLNTFNRKSSTKMGKANVYLSFGTVHLFTCSFAEISDGFAPRM